MKGIVYMEQKRKNVKNQNDNDLLKLIDEDETGIKMTHEQIIESYSNWGTQSNVKNAQSQDEEWINTRI